QRDLSSVRVIINGGEKMPIPLIERLQRTFPSAWFADAYGLTETVSGDTFLDRDSVVTKLGSGGRPCLYLELDIWDKQGRSVRAGERGEIVMRGPKVFKGYWRDPDATSAAFAGGWFHTGDIGVQDDDGYVYIVDRLKDMIVSGGENIASSEVERVLYEHETVVEAALGGRPAGRWGEVSDAFVVRRDDKEAGSRAGAGCVDLTADRAVLVREEGDHRRDEVRRHLRSAGLAGGLARHPREGRGCDEVDLDAVRGAFGREAAREPD